MFVFREENFLLFFGPLKVEFPKHLVLMSDGKVDVVSDPLELKKGIQAIIYHGMALIKYVIEFK